MTPQIKQRIEKIKNGEVPDGYKKTKIGIVPKEWKIICFKKMFTRLTRKNQENNTNVLTLSAQNGLVSQEEFFNKSIASDDKANYFLVKCGDYAYNKSYSNGYPYGTIKRLEKYKKGILSPLYICFSPSCNNRCSDFYSQYFEAGLMDREIKTFAQEGARNHGLLNISVNDFFNAQLICPPLTEQQKIAEILTTQDKIIELKERKLAELKKLKKYYLSKMFPKRGSSYPEVRFPGFTDPWEQYMFCDMFSEKREKTSNENEDVLLSCAISGMYLNSELFGHFRGSTTIGYLKVKKNDLILSAQNLHLGNANVNLRFDHGIISPAYKVFELVNCDPNFVQSWVKKEDTKNFFLAASTEGASQCRKNIEWSMLNKKFILVPKINEQKIIGSFFHNIDKLITLHQRELDEEKRLKKSLMQLLLKGIVRV